MHIEQPNEPLLVLLYTTNSGIQHTAYLTKSQILEFIEYFKEGKNYVVTSFNETYGFNPNLISDFKVVDLYQKNIKIDKKQEDVVNLNHNKEEITDEQLIELKNTLENKDLAKAYYDTLDFFKIDCRCKTTYVVQISSKTNTGYCNNCQEQLKVDRSYGKVDTYKGMAWIMTNKYYVTKEMMEVNSSDT